MHARARLKKRKRERERERERVQDWGGGGRGREREGVCLCVCLCVGVCVCVCTRARARACVCAPILERRHVRHQHHPTFSVQLNLTGLLVFVDITHHAGNVIYGPGFYLDITCNVIVYASIWLIGLYGGKQRQPTPPDNVVIVEELEVIQ